mgnify:CR=1 FL=1
MPFSALRRASPSVTKTRFSSTNSFYAMQFRSNSAPLRHAWIAGCAFAGLLFLVGVAGWALQAGPGREALMGYGIGAVVVWVFSRGLYNRSIMSGILILLVALGPTIKGLLQWTMGVMELGQPASVLMRGTVALSGLGLSVMVIRAMYSLSRGESSRSSLHNTPPYTA